MENIEVFYSLIMLDIFIEKFYKFMFKVKKFRYIFNIEN
ncbi:hypothetical protein JGS6364_08141 [[Clostridium] sordellii]|uniref:Uncharacterized protein n=1 Tax=Paraclostridium sordellii TaxID=1505 RepID=A0ABM9RN62_PARSO|nr:hypothetical protein ATCC9714_13551 [[Clostridium] sordellii] [Paeniclostridium sordellii]CEK30168.1 hypothetical protein JGS6364_08141 [[Clostridium] sordellii] [Paeniclostridium sordellii]CEN69018.1 Uncharacterised protein [[Clostridium] sordellii] [Paeniclostridium sordellii]CEN72285.1 Uncharacterised protein [[Clostridium] sordellii] [Paeniclostridium sordellii]CEO23571.1 Uncharacterised protein [[Clostridium] sordellii] [Paeniclostridium sordellii]